MTSSWALCDKSSLTIDRDTGVKSDAPLAAPAFDKSFLRVKTSDEDIELDTVAHLAESKAPLVVSLHTWSGSWEQKDLLANPIRDAGWNYLHPNFRGRNNNSDACLSDKVIKDIDDAIEWAVAKGVVDEERIYLIGVSGGGHAALGYRLRSKFKIKHTFAWAPITSLKEWYYQMRLRKSVQKYDITILKCHPERELELSNLARRSPIDLPENDNGTVSLYAGINDGYTGSVPISHSINYFNKLALPDDRIGKEMIVSLLTRGIEETADKLGDRAVYFDSTSGKVRLVVFDGGHEMLKDVALADLGLIAN